MKARICTRLERLDAHSRKGKQRYKHDYDYRVHETPSFKQNDSIFISRALLVTTKDGDASNLAEGTYNKLMPHTLWRFQNSASSHMLLGEPLHHQLIVEPLFSRHLTVRDAPSKLYYQIAIRIVNKLVDCCDLLSKQSVNPMIKQNKTTPERLLYCSPKVHSCSTEGVYVPQHILAWTVEEQFFPSLQYTPVASNCLIVQISLWRKRYFESAIRIRDSLYSSSLFSPWTQGSSSATQANQPSNSTRSCPNSALISAFLLFTRINKDFLSFVTLWIVAAWRADMRSRSFLVSFAKPGTP